MPHVPDSYSLKIPKQKCLYSRFSVFNIHCWKKLRLLLTESELQVAKQVSMKGENETALISRWWASLEMCTASSDTATLVSHKISLCQKVKKPN